MTDDLPLIMESLNAGTGGLSMDYGLPKSEVLKVCKEMYKKEVVKLTLQISDPVAMQLNKNMKVSLVDQIGTFGKSEKNNLSIFSIQLLVNYRWNHWSIHRSKPRKLH